MWVYPEIRSVGQYPEYWACHDPERAALRTPERTVSFAEFDRIANRVANFLSTRVLQQPELIGFIGRNSLVFYFALFGAAKTRSGLVIYNWRLSALELSAQIDDSGAQIAIVERDFEALAAAGGKGGRTPRRSASAEADATPRSTPSPMARADASPPATTSSPPISSATSTSPPPPCGGYESWPEAANLTTTSSEPSCVVPHSTENCSGRRARTRSGLIGNRS